MCEVFAQFFAVSDVFFDFFCDFSGFAVESECEVCECLVFGVDCGFFGVALVFVEVHFTGFLGQGFFVVFGLV